MGKNVFVVTQWVDYGCYEIIGVFDTEEKAIAACRTENHGYGPVELNKDLGDMAHEWLGFSYPLREK